MSWIPDFRQISEKIDFMMKEVKVERAVLKGQTYNESSQNFLRICKFVI